jgi:hypothetical protein
MALQEERLVLILAINFSEERRQHTLRYEMSNSEISSLYRYDKHDLRVKIYFSEFRYIIACLNLNGNIKYTAVGHNLVPNFF